MSESKYQPSGDDPIDNLLRQRKWHPLEEIIDLETGSVDGNNTSGLDRSIPPTKFDINVENSKPNQNN